MEDAKAKYIYIYVFDFLFTVFTVNEIDNRKMCMYGSTVREAERCVKLLPAIVLQTNICSLARYSSDPHFVVSFVMAVGT